MTSTDDRFWRKAAVHTQTASRHYGLFAKGACANNIARARGLLAAAKPEGPPATAAVDPSKPACPCCGGRMIIIEVFTRGATPRHQPTAPTNRIRIDTS
jgi:hypothetical protein